MDRPKKETLTVEFKSDRAPLKLDDLYKEVVAMANTDGGIIYLGIEDDGTVTGLHSQHSDIIAIGAKIQTHTHPPIAPNLKIEQFDNKPVLVIEVISSRNLVMTSDGRYLRRRLKYDGSPEMTALLPNEIIQRLSSIQQFDPSSQVVEQVRSDVALNPLERERLRSMIQTYHGDPSLLNLSNDDLDKALELSHEYDGILYPTITGLLLIGHEQYIKKYVPGHEVLFQVLSGEDVLSNSPAMRGSLLSIFETVSVLFQSRVTESEIQVGLFRVPIPNYEKEAFREGFVNALVHRDYYRMGSIHVQLQKHNLIISNPGGFLEGVTPDNILTVAPSPRNRLLAEAGIRIGLAERTGRGVDKIYSSLLRSGHDIPDYSDSDNTRVVLRMNSAEVDKEFVRMLVEEERKINQVMPINALIILNALKYERRLSLSDFAKRIQRRESDAKETVEWLVEIGMVEGIGNGAARRYMLSSNVYALSGNAAGYSRQRGLTTEEEIAQIQQVLNETSTITRAKVVEICSCSDNHASYLLRTLVDNGIIELVRQGRNTYYLKKNK